MAHIITTEAKYLNPGAIFTFLKRKTKFVFIEDKRTYYVYKNQKTEKVYESDFYGDIVEIYYK
ncbi:hypothetical protein [Aquimarina algiphila]|uniref:hypothetical protein n=1 Tax=Aquimarina algiphila TaxID=2047982 RepID=UPI0023301433|nr:hypothetical protein [Aquimarina algiphila]